MFVRIILMTLFSLAANAEPTTPKEYPWTKVAASDLEKLDVRLGDLRVNNFALERDPRRTTSGTASVHEFSASIGNRSNEVTHVLIQIIGVKQDNVPTLSSEGSVDVESRHNEILRASAYFPEQTLGETNAYYVRILTTPPD